MSRILRIQAKRQASLGKETATVEFEDERRIVEVRESNAEAVRRRGVSES